MDSFTEENMEECDEHITDMEVDSTGGCKSLLFTGYCDIISETKDQNDSFPYSLYNEPQRGVKKHGINIPEQQTVSDDLEHDSEIEIYDEMGQIKKNIVSAARKIPTYILDKQKEIL